MAGNVLMEGQVGPRQVGDGSEVEVRLDRTSAVVTTDAHARYHEAVLRGNAYSAMTPAAGVAPGTAIGTTAAFTLYNPKAVAGSAQKYLVVVRAVMGYISGTLGAGSVVWAANTDPAAAAPSAGTALTPVNNLIGAAMNSVAVPRSGGTLPAAPTILRPAFILGAGLATTAALPAAAAEEDAGDLVIAPGAALSLEAIAAAGTTPLVAFGVTWIEETF